MVRRMRMRIRSVQDIYENCHISKPFEERNHYVESNLEQNFKYFDFLNDDREVPDSEILRRKLAKQKR